MFRRTTIVSTLVAGAVALGSAAAAHAVDLRGGSIQMVLQKEEADGDFVDMSQTEIDEFFNLSNCLCPVNLGVEITLSGTSGTLASEAVEVWVGANCDNTADVALRDQQCVRVDVIPDIFKTVTNSTGFLSAATIVARLSPAPPAVPVAAPSTAPE